MFRAPKKFVIPKKFKPTALSLDAIQSEFRHDDRWAVVTFAESKKHAVLPWYWLFRNPETKELYAYWPLSDPNGMGLYRNKRGLTPMSNYTTYLVEKLIQRKLTSYDRVSILILSTIYVLCI